VPVTETVWLVDAFGGNLDTPTWTIGVLTGQQDPAISVATSGGMLQIGPLLQGTPNSHYNGIVANAFVDLTGAYAYVQVPAVPATNTTADAMLTVALDDANHYRIFEENGVLNFQKRVATVKTTIGTATYDPTQMGFWRIRHDNATDQIKFETAQNVAGAPGTWVTKLSAARELAVTAVKVELKGGTYQTETNNPGTVTFDNVRVAKP